MSLEDVGFYLICAVTWFILLPVLLICGTIVLLGYAVFSELRDNTNSRAEKHVDEASAREMARRLCAGS